MKWIPTLSVIFFTLIVLSGCQKDELNDLRSDDNFQQSNPTEYRASDNVDRGEGALSTRSYNAGDSTSGNNDGNSSAACDGSDSDDNTDDDNGNGLINDDSDDEDEGLRPRTPQLGNSKSMSSRF